MSRELDLVVVGGGIAGTMAVLVAASRGIDVGWIADDIGPDDQSAHWHGHLHRGRLYDPVRERELIEELEGNAHFWWSDAVTPFHTATPTLAVGPDDAWADAYRTRLGGGARPVAHPHYLRDDVRAVGTDEAILDGPAFLCTARRIAAAGATTVRGRCTRVRGRSGRWRLDWTDTAGARGELAARRVIIATGTAAGLLVPADVRLDRTLDSRLSRMLVLRGDLPAAAAIVPSRSAGGLFFASRETGRPGDRVWLVSDGFSSPGNLPVGALTDGWWACSVVERLTGFLREEAFADLGIGAYRAPKSRLQSSPTQVPAEGYALGGERTLACLTPSKWTSSPTSAASAVAALLPERRTMPDTLAAVAGLLAGFPAPNPLPLQETWQTVDTSTPLADLLPHSTSSLRAAAGLFARTARSGAAGIADDERVVA